MPITLPNTNGNTTENSPICRSSRVLYRIRLQMSRPKLSVPSGCSGLNGGWNASPRLCAIGSYGVRSGAAIATRTTSPNSTRPASSVALSPTFWSRSAKLSGSAGATSDGKRPVSTCSVIRHAWIEKRIRQIYDQIDDDHQHRADDCDGLHDGIVATGNRREEQLANAGHGEDRFNHQRSTHQKSELHAEDRNRGQERVAQGVPHEHQSVGQSFGARRAHEIRTRRQNDLAPQVADEHRR